MPGKSTLMRRVQRRLEGKAPNQHSVGVDARTVWFNVWAAPDGGALEGLIRSVLDQLDTNILRRVARRRKLIRGLRLGASVLAGFLRVGNVVDRIWEQVSVDPKQRNELNDFVRDAMNAWLQKRSSSEGRLIVVFIDDLDRCSPATVLQVFEAMKLYLDAPGFVFILGWDTEQVLRAVAAEKGAEDRLPERYIQKIVQFGFRIPRPPIEQLTRLATNLCEAAGLTTDVLGVDQRQLLLDATDGNPRQLKRFINRFILLQDSVGDDVDAAVVIQLMVLQASYDAFFRLLANVPGDDDDENPLFEFTAFAAARQAMSRGDKGRVQSILEQRGYVVGDDVSGSLQAFTADLPAEYPQLVVDRPFCDLVLQMSDEVKRQVRRMARSDELVTTPSTAPGPTPVAPGSSYGQPPVAPGTTVLWIDDEPKADEPVAATTPAST